ncbi:Scr1 family TA system antitoxin-like transcriptional regulator [Streptomyces sp. NPDC021093]|uniref:helix-turn-helix domain-containing protein n=1 Tax=Streptomyces sp. NPDC021093 TaxID=3365112 RepID=UPI0037B72682
MSTRNAAGGKVATPGETFGKLIKHHRESMLLTQIALAGQIPCDRSQVARVEAGTRVPDLRFVQGCSAVFGMGQTLLNLWQEIDWYPDVQHPDWFDRRAKMDAEAAALREYQVQVMPGLLQTEDYIRALYSQVEQDVVNLEKLVRARLSRQHRFLTPDGPLYLAVLDESCIRNIVGTAAIMRDQCAHLLRVGNLPNIRVQIAPASAVNLARPNTSMSLITLPDHHNWIYSESVRRGHFNDDPAEFTRQMQTYDVLRADALSASESATLISDAMEGYDQHADTSRPQRGELDQVQLQRQRRRKLRGNRPRIPHPRPRT